MTNILSRTANFLLLLIIITSYASPVCNTSWSAPDERMQQVHHLTRPNQFLIKAAEAEATGNYQEAIEYSKQYLDACNSDDYTAAVKSIESKRTALELKLSKMKNQKTGMSSLKQINNINLIDTCRMNANKHIAENYARLARYEDALKYCKDGMGYAESLNDQNRKKIFLQLMSSTYTALGRPEEAEKYREQASKIDMKSQAAMLDESSRQTLPKELTEKLDRIKHYGANMMNTQKNVSNLIDRARREKSLGLYTSALNTYDRALQMVKTDRKGFGNFEAIAVNQIMDILCEKGSVYLKVKDYAKAESSVREAEILEEEAKELSAKTLGDEYEKLKAIDRDGSFERQQKIFQNWGAKNSRYNRILLQADISIESGRYSDALKFINNMSGELTDTPIHQIRYHTQKGRLFKGTGQLRESSYEYYKAVSLVEEIRGQIKQEKSGFFTAEDRTDAYRGLVYVLSERALKGEKDDRLALYGNNLLSSAFYFSELTKGRTLLEKMAESEGRGADARLPDTLRTTESSLLSDLSELNDQLETTSVRNKDTLKSLKERKEKLTSELNTLINELWDKYPRYAALHYPRPVQADKLPLKDNEVLLEYALGDNFSYVFIVRKGGVVRVSRISAGREMLEEKVQTFMSKMNIKTLSGFSVKEAKELYTLLLADALKDVKKTDKIIIVPDGILGLLPFETLAINEGKNINNTIYVGDQYMITYTQSATVMALNRLLKPASALKPLFALGNPVYSKSDQRYIAYMQKKEAPAMLVARTDAGLRAVTVIPKSYKAESGSITWEEVFYPSLPETEDEVRIIAGFFNVPIKPPDILLNMNANETTLRSVPLADYRYIHFATHADTGGKIQDIKEPFLLLGQVENKEGDNGFFTLSKVLGLKLDADMVILSACLTGRGRVMEGEGVANFARAFQYAGARSVVTSLWEVPSKETVEYMTIFYRNLSMGKSKGDALAVARSEMKRKYPHPYYWASFIMHGER